MKRLGLIISLFLVVLVLPQTIKAACVAPIGPDFTSCPASNPSACNVYNDQTGTTDLTCCTSPSECTNFTQAPPGSLPPQGSSFNPFAGCNGTSEINTAIGCIPTDFTSLFNKFFSLGIGIAGGIAFLLILFGGFQILTSAGNPERLAAGKELVTSAITGLLMIIFSVFLLQLIGVDILGIPGFK